MLTLTWNVLIWMPALVGLGSAFRSAFEKLTRKKRAAGNSISEDGILGVIATGVATLFLNFFTALSNPVSVALCVLGWTFIFLRRKKIVGGLRGVHVFSVFALVYVLIQAGTTEPIYDTGLYHLQAIRWVQQFPITLGLANLHDRLGFNSIWFLIAAVTGLSLNVIFTFFFTLSCLEAAEALLKKKDSIADWFLLIASYLLFSKIIYTPISTPSTDTPVNLLVVLTVYRLLRNDRGFALILASLALVIKLSAFPLWIASMVFYFFSKKEKSHVAAIIFSALALLAWLVRGLMTSGCLTFPSLCFTSFSWSDPSSATNQADWITSWGRAPGKDKNAVLASWEWLSPWLVNFWNQLDAKIVLILTALGITLTLATRTRVDRKQGLLFASLFACIGFWFLKAPNLRFGWGYLTTTGILVFSVGTHTFLKKYRMQSLGAYLTLLTIGLTLRTSTAIRETPHWDWPKIKTVSGQTRSLENGGKVFIPLKGDQCWDLPLPCTPYFNPSLQIRRTRNRCEMTSNH